MFVFHTFEDAQFAAEEYFFYHYGHHNVEVHLAHLKEVEFQTTDDSNLKESFRCIIDDGMEYFCTKRGKLKIVNPDAD